MTNEHIKVLLIEDSPVAAAMVEGMLSEVQPGLVTLEYADCLSAGLKRLALSGIDVILLDLSLPDSEGIETFACVHTQAPHVPIVILTGLDDEKVAIEAMHQGAQDYLAKGHVDGNLLVRSIRYSVERKRSEDDRVQQERLHAILELAGDACHELNQPMQAMSGYSELLLMSMEDDHPLRDYAEKIKQQADRMKRVTRKLSNITAHARRDRERGTGIGATDESLGTSQPVRQAAVSE